MARFTINTFHILIVLNISSFNDMYENRYIYLVIIFVKSIYSAFYADPPFTLKVAKNYHIIRSNHRHLFSFPEEVMKFVKYAALQLPCNKSAYIIIWNNNSITIMSVNLNNNILELPTKFRAEIKG